MSSSDPSKGKESDKMDVEKKEEKKEEKEKDKEKDKKESEKKKADGDDDKDKDAASSAVSATSRLLQPSSVVVHPLVLLSVVDHYHRVAKDTSKRVVGVLLGEVSKGKVDVTNSYALPFEEDSKEASIWYIDRQYHEEMYAMFKKVQAKEKVIGWYSTGPKLRPSDIEINELFRSYCSHPVYVIIDVNPKDDATEIPTEAYYAIESSPEDKSSEKARRTFIHLPSTIGAYEAEEVGVEHLLRGVKDTLVSTLSDEISAKLNSLKSLRTRLNEIIKYLNLVVEGKLPVNHSILNELQNAFNYLPDLRSNLSSLRSFTVTTNDHFLSLYLSSLIRSILVLHDLIKNKLINREIEKEETKKVEEAKKKRRAERAAEEKKKQEEQEKKEKGEEEKSKMDEDKPSDSSEKK